MKSKWRRSGAESCISMLVLIIAVLVSSCSAPKPAMPRPDAVSGVPSLGRLNSGVSPIRNAAPVPSGLADDTQLPELLSVPPPAPREFRAAWVSTVANIDWPSRSTLTVAQQQAEILAILDRASALHLNAILLQVRPSADAIYPSKLEPWSEFLTGRQGQAPQPWYDPLLFWIVQAHARGLELHAWFNPYRARHSAAKTALTPDHIANAKPETVKKYGKLLWMDPGESAAMQQTEAVIFDVVQRYDIDGVLLDDYFYPYPIDASAGASTEGELDDGAGRSAGSSELEFPDQPSWQRYLLSGGLLERAAWRRQNVDHLIEALYQGIHHEKNWVRFGISPFGIGRPDRRPPGIVGFSQYDKLYANAELWLAKGWLDYLSPQLYWPIAQAPQAFDVLLDYWMAQNPRGRHIWPGLFTSRIPGRRVKHSDLSTPTFAAQEIIRQIAVTRSRAGINGHAHFSMAALMENRKGISDLLSAATYRSAALIPSSPWLGTQPPLAPVVHVLRASQSVSLILQAGPGTGNAPAPASYAIWSLFGKEWRFSVVPAVNKEWLLQDDAVFGAPLAIVVSAVDRLGNESARISVLDGAVSSVARANR